MKKIISIISVSVALLFILPNVLFAEGLPTDPNVTGPSGTLYVNTTHNFNLVSTDPSGLNIRYEVIYDNSGTTLYYPSSSQYVTSGTSQTTSKSYSTPGSYLLRARTRNTDGDYSSWVTYNYTISAPNSAPNTPTVTMSPVPTQINRPYWISFSSTDPEGNQVYYQFDWNMDGTYDTVYPSSGFVGSGGAPQSTQHTWTSYGNNSFYVRAVDSFGATSNNYSFSLNIPNPNPGSAPTNPIAPNTSGLINIPVSFTFTSSDADGDPVKYQIDWDADSNFDETVPSSGYATQNTTQNTSHTWSTVGTKNINIRAVDSQGLASGWTSLTAVITATNVPPTAPTITLVAGQDPLYPNTRFDFSVSADDPDSSQVAFLIDWDNNGSYEGSTILDSDSAPRIIMNPVGTWTTPGTYTFRMITSDSRLDYSAPTSFNITIVPPPPPRLNLSLTPPYLTLGQSTYLTINWSATDATSCQATGLTWPGHNTLSGSYTTTSLVSSPRSYTWVCTGNGVTATTTVALSYPVDLFGWGWSSNIGWISFSSANSGVGAGSAYSVKMGTSTDRGFLGGWAWSPNIGWISFSNGDGAHPNGVVDFNTGAVTGWARACAATVRGDCNSATRADWDGWISLSGSNHGSPGQGVTYDASTGKFRGFSWGSETVGWLTMDSLISPPLQGPIVVSTSTPSCSITTNPASLPVAGGSVNVSWTSTGVVGNSCRVDGPNGFAYSNMSGNDNRTTNISSSGNGGRYTLRCNTDTIICSANLDKTPPQPPPVFPKMWLDNDPGESKDITTIRQGTSAIVNWKLGTKYTGCVGSNVEQSNASLQPGPTWFNSGVETVPYKYRATIPNLTVGKYVLTLQCDNGNKTNNVTIIVKGANSTTIEEK